MRLGYNTNGLAHHRWDDALRLIADTGYESVALTVDHHCLSPDSPTRRTDAARMAALLDRLKLRCVIETGARFLLDPSRKHEPTLISSKVEERARRQQFLRYCVELAVELDADAVSFWAGCSHEREPTDVLWQRLVDGCRNLTDFAGLRAVKLAFEPEPGMLVQTGDEFDRLQSSIDAPHFGLTLDIGHVHCLNDGLVANHIQRWPERLFNVHIEDMQPGIHEHLPFGEGSINFVPVMSALRAVDYPGGVHVELSRHSHLAPLMLRRAHAFLTARLAEATHNSTPRGMA